MLLLLLAYLGGVLTIVSPCILPVLPFVFARADRPFYSNGLPTLIGMAVVFALVATLAAVGGGWAVAANVYGRYIALAVMALLGVTLIFPELAERLSRPVVALGNRLSQRADATTAAGEKQSILSPLLLGGAIGLLWAPCAGPILGLILTGAALNGANVQTTGLLVAYAAGAATSLALALLAGNRVFQAMKGSLGTSEWIRRGLGVAVLAATAAIALGADTGFLTRLSTTSTAAIEQRLVDAFRKPRGSGDDAKVAHTSDDLAIEGMLPSLGGAVEWLNSPPLSADELKGKVVLIDFWTYSCINCLRTIPYVRAWAEKYKNDGLVVIGVHTPEFAFEKDANNVRRALTDLKISYPVAIDNNYSIWRAFKNQYWPAHYFIDAHGNVRYHHYGEGEYERSEKVIQKLLMEAGQSNIPQTTVAVTGSGVEASSQLDLVKSPETYIGYNRAENFVSPGGAVRDVAHDYRASASTPMLNQWALAGKWTIGGQHARLDAAPGSIDYRFHARDLHLVLGPGADGKPVRFRVTIDGKAPGADHGADTDAEGNGTVTNNRLYQLVRQADSTRERTFSIEFLDPGVEAYAFTFG
ncbi:cytochrome C biogenesis protein [Hyphomicrobium methylovorum]|uniref:cytochrome c biogenesis protein DipZ n=1 Tax=Hyphomicrobium methylovorum TaxID=84 RepID=UPI0015E735D0|nr:cytochrome c biogenesis protein DipZ [Hyphomicrobium methylovorum]MBA2125042.1 cytochrome C biogenesis protein [Hyphomicrobium methylovorum]